MRRALNPLTRVEAPRNTACMRVVTHTDSKLGGYDQMKRIVIALIGGIMFSATAMAAAQKPGPTGTEVTYTGCLQAGASDGTYSLISASEKGKKNPDNGKISLKIVPADPKVSLAPQLSHSVEVTGTLAATGSSAGSDRPVLTAKKVKWHADFCG